jgi:hypothetical protein
MACVAGLILTFAWPVADAQQDEQEPSLGGIYTVTISRLDIPNDMPGGPSLIGQWIITLADDGTYTVARQDVGVVAAGTYEVNGATLKFSGWEGLVGCAGSTERIEADDAGATATYAWRFEDDALVLTPIHESCSDRRLILTTRSFVTYEPCMTVPFGSQPSGAPEESAAPTAAATPSVALQEGVADASTLEDEIDALLRQATGCWATGDPARFLPLHSQRALADIAFGFGPLPDFARSFQIFMSTPASFERIGDVHLEDATHAWCYVEITLGSDVIPQRTNFVKENGVWLFDNFFLLGPPTEGQPAGPDDPRLTEQTPDASEQATAEPTATVVASNMSSTFVAMPEAVADALAAAA